MGPQETKINLYHFARALSVPALEYVGSSVYHERHVLQYVFGAVVVWYAQNLNHGAHTRLKSIIARLERNITRPWTYHGLYDSENKTKMDQAWDDISIDAGNVALGDSFVEAMGLPKAQRFPWDGSKGIYYLNGYQNLHCLVGSEHLKSPLIQDRLMLSHRRRSGGLTFDIRTACLKQETWVM